MGSAPPPAKVVGAGCSDIRDVFFCCLDLLTLFVEGLCSDGTGKREKMSILKGLENSDLGRTT